MAKLNLIECCILEASAELNDAARDRLHEHLAAHPRALHQFVEIQSQMNLLRSLPVVQLSPSQQRQFAAAIKTGIHRKLHAQTLEKRAARRWKFVSYALSSLAAAAAVIVVGAVILADHSALQRTQLEKTARIERATERLALYGDQTTPYDLAITNAQASVTQIQTEGPTLVAGLDNTEMSSVLNALTTPQFEDPDFDRP